jgi:hypothetical protein
MTEPVDTYCDQFGLNLGPFGATLNFLMTSPNPPPAGTIPQAERMASIRVSLEHLKVMTFMLRRQIMQYEQQQSTDVGVPQDVLNSLRISQEDWQALWRQP